MRRWTIHQHDVTQPWPLTDGSVQCIVTSPPYWGLRDYGGCGCGTKRHDCGQGEGTGGNLNYRVSSDPDCPKCNGTGRVVGMDAQLGLEPTPGEYVAKMVGVFREARRVLRDDGTLWLNLGDSYMGYWGDKKALAEGRPSAADTNGWTNGFNMNAKPKYATLRDTGLKPKDLIGIPWRVAFALQADGWWLRSDIIWAKPNPMPESVTDRSTKAHEYVFLLSKSARYWYDAAAINERLQTPAHAPGNTTAKGVVMRNDIGTERMAAVWGANGTRNRRTVWTIATEPYAEAHFATFPTALVEPCIKAGSKEGDTVLDPFAGSGTTLMVACRLNRDAVGLELSPAYVEMARRRIQGDAPLLNREQQEPTDAAAGETRS